ncbi:hypothetical protein PAXRUDRAFT_10176 [Paxillus rubicundulus Ve08.2h10]|uniref:Transcription factor tau subunit sfc6 n=1 Tax=Paxillus rubicundulus Ve08.2h10 TaxID=930991 RepID=A0A0D0E780_9AGAM|nr:hypothetical protein PAXRUDRAFT_10176 [Paxillus rubicundulus Ve08.2h10]
MPRELHPGRSRQNYTEFADYDIEDGEDVGPSLEAQLMDEEGGDESEPAPETGPNLDSKKEQRSDSDGDFDMDVQEDQAPEVPVAETSKRSRQVVSSAAAAAVQVSRGSTNPATFVSSKTRKDQSRRLPPKMQLEQGPSTSSVVAPRLTAPRTSKMYALPNPSAHHRHRAIPVFLRKEMVERLEKPPSLFEEPQIASTNSITASQSLTDRISKAWGFNVGAGPVWEIMEDRSCYKEAIDSSTSSGDESSRRPRVYQNISVRPGWEVLSYKDACRYLPTDAVMTDDEQFKPPPKVDCYIGPYGQQTLVAFNMFDSVATCKCLLLSSPFVNSDISPAKYFKDGKSYVFNAGSPVWGVDWCPTHPEDRSGEGVFFHQLETYPMAHDMWDTARNFKHYLAIAPVPSRSHAPSIGAKVSLPSPACVQIWALGLSIPDENAIDDDDPRRDPAEIRCEMVLCLEGGPAQDIKWCPLPAHDRWECVMPRDAPRKLGILAGTFEDGSLSIYTVPDPEDVKPSNHDRTLPVFVKLSEPALRIELEGTSCWSLDWANSEVIAVGLTNGEISVTISLHRMMSLQGCIAVYDVKNALAGGDGPSIFPTHFISVHQSAIRALAWIRVPPTNSAGVPITSGDPTVIASGGYDGVECLTDIREPHGNVVNRTRDVINSTTYSAFAAGPIMIDHDNTVKSYSVSPSMLGRGHVLMEPDGPVWSVNASEYHPQLAVGSADGSCTTTNLLKSTRRGGAVPFLVHKIYQLDYSRKTGELRMLDHFLPQETQERSVNVKGTARTKKEGAQAVGINNSTGVWPQEIGVHRVAWNSGNGLSGAPLLASATGSGLCRVDWLLGRWIKDKVPYVSVPDMRQEVERISDEESENN